MIQNVKTWTVSYWRGSNLLAHCEVDTINKRFARWLATGVIGYPATYSMLYPGSDIRVTVSRKRR